MRFAVTRISIQLACFLIGNFAFAQAQVAQIDPSSGLLLNNSARGANRESGLDSGRYTVRPPRSDSHRREESRSQVRPSVAEPMPTIQSVDPVPAPEKSDATTELKSAPPMELDQDAPSVAGEIKERPGQSEEETQRSTQDHHGSATETNWDRRLNLLEISIAPAFLYTDSDSTFAYRSYFVSGPGLSAEARVWFNPNFALHTSYIGSIGGSVNDSFDGSRNTSVSQQWFTAGLRSRKFFGSTVMAPSLTFGLNYYEYQFRVPADAAIRERLGSSGVQVVLEGDFPVSSHRAWTLSFSVAPKLQHKEIATGIDFQSGGGVEANAIGFAIGGRLQFDRTHAIYYKMSHKIERNLFSGDASVADPVTGLVPHGVSVTNSFTIMQFGYTWGN